MCTASNTVWGGDTSRRGYEAKLGFVSGHDERDTLRRARKRPSGEPITMYWSTAKSSSPTVTAAAGRGADSTSAVAGLCREACARLRTSC